jgi:hypothetical protein
MESARHLMCACAAIVLLAGCAQRGAPPTYESIEAPKLDALESAYDRKLWRWVRNPDGRALLTHTRIAQCFVDPEPPLNFHDGVTLKRHEKTIGGTRYEVVSAFEKRQFWEAVYVRSGSTTPSLGVYAEGACQLEAEHILAAYEKGLAR